MESDPVTEYVKTYKTRFKSHINKVICEYKRNSSSVELILKNHRISLTLTSFDEQAMHFNISKLDLVKDEYSYTSIFSWHCNKDIQPPNEDCIITVDRDENQLFSDIIGFPSFYDAFQGCLNVCKKVLNDPKVKNLLNN